MESSIVNYSYSVVGNHIGIDWASWITAIATGLMAYFAWKALGSWKNELKCNKTIDAYNRLYELVYNLAIFLDNFCIVKDKHGEVYINQRLNEFNSKFQLLQSEIDIIGNKNLLKYIDYCIENVKSTFIIEKDLKDDVSCKKTAWTESFISKYMNNTEFNKDLSNTISTIKELCKYEQKKFYN